jgi:hypothetical protein
MSGRSARGISRRPPGLGCSGNPPVATVDQCDYVFLGGGKGGNTQAGEVVSTVQMAMLGKLPYTAVRNAILSHPTIGEGLNLLFAKVSPDA